MKQIDNPDLVVGLVVFVHIVCFCAFNFLHNPAVSEPQTPTSPQTIAALTKENKDLKQNKKDLEGLAATLKKGIDTSKNDIDAPGNRGIYKHQTGWCPLCITWIAGFEVSVLALWTLFHHILNRADREPADREQEGTYLKKWIASRATYLVVWVIGPPIWFFLEYFFLFKSHGAPGTFDQFKYGQELASKIWLGIVTLLTAELIKFKLTDAVPKPTNDS